MSTAKVNVTRDISSDRIRQLIAQREQERDAFLQAANQKLAQYQAVIGELRQLIGLNDEASDG